MKPFHFLAVMALILTVGCSAVGQTSVHNETSAPSKKAVVEASFQQWQDGAGSPFELLSEDMRWTISGFNTYAGTYTREPFEEELIAPFNERVEEPLRPTQWQVYEDGDVVIIHFDAETTLINGEQYRNSYAWFFTFEDEEVTKVTAFLDMPAFEKVLEIEVR
ncbi:ketosteroid isomerase [Romeria aff. gracilis LEGE 07310]|uniref:Ketosteroid isomerase n=1 Tax=Vasconcelosia minhoensis LEGE 07310 TaxID=915328 RepID=A0A8J7B0X7_9CYAN|nr:nuclear transport factor 2 family protein [Romeria gracilis]MBE9080292.1 ketosteroid isomerase [Romeria aff. gracilis LEGE 07310]